MLCIFGVFGGVGGQVAFDVSGGVQFAKVKDSRTGNLDDFNPLRRGMWTSVGLSYEISRGVAIKSNLTYQQRQPLEQYYFITDTLSGGTSYENFIRYPSNPQNSLFRMDNYTNFQDFKYLGLEIGPTYRIPVGAHFDVELGLLLFGNALLNKEQTTVEPAELLWIQRGVPGLPPLLDNNSYRRFDAGFLPFLQFRSYQGEQLTIGLQLKGYFSRTLLPEPGFAGRELFELRWISYATGLTVSWKFVP